MAVVIGRPTDFTVELIDADLDAVAGGVLNASFNFHSLTATTVTTAIAMATSSSSKPSVPSRIDITQRIREERDTGSSPPCDGRLRREPGRRANRWRLCLTRRSRRPPIPGFFPVMT
jgi:hypothetical protein